MLSPGAATALVNEALTWLGTDLMQALRVDFEPRQAGNLPPAHGAPVSAALASALAAVLSFLEAHITARQVSCAQHGLGGLLSKIVITRAGIAHRTLFVSAAPSGSAAVSMLASVLTATFMVAENRFAHPVL